jgi:ssDNA-binding Zn-finger/Zn-ribbon topoisomerase 1
MTSSITCSNIVKHIAENIKCDKTEVFCKLCNSFMVIRKKDDREFLACSSYYKTGCRYTQNFAYREKI